MDLDKLGYQLEKIVGAFCESTSAQERLILTQSAIGKYYKAENELLRNENDQIDQQISKDEKEIEETEKKIQDVKEIKDQLISALSTNSNVMKHLIARRTEIRENVINWETKINKTVQMMDDFVKKETGKRENENELFKQVMEKRNRIKALKIEQAVVEERIKMQKRQIKQQKEINDMLFRSDIVEFVKAIKIHNRSIQLDKDIAEMKIALNEMTIKFNKLSSNKLSSFKMKSVFSTTFQQTRLNTLKPSNKIVKMDNVQENSSNIFVKIKEDKIISKQSDKTTPVALKAQPPKSDLFSTDQESNDRKDFQQRSDERKRKYLRLMSSSIDDIMTNYQDEKETNLKRSNSKTGFEKENLQNGVSKKIENKVNKEENCLIPPKTPSKKIKLIDNITIQKPSSSVEGQFLVPKSLDDRKQKKVSFFEKQIQEDHERLSDSTSTAMSGNESHQSFVIPNTVENAVSKFFKKPDEQNSFWGNESNNEVSYSFLSPTEYNPGKTTLENTDESTVQEDFFLTPNDNNGTNFLNFSFGMGNQQSSNNQFSLF